MTGTSLQLLLLLVAANSAPVLAEFFLGSRGATPVDRGLRLPDGRPLFGSSKTWRGLLAALLATSLLSWWLGYGMRFGLVFGAAAMIGDLASSFTKRRLGKESSAKSTGLDQVPESFLPSLYAVWVLDLSWWYLALLPAAFMVLEIVVSRPLYKLHIRKRPY